VSPAVSRHRPGAAWHPARVPVCAGLSRSWRMPPGFPDLIGAGMLRLSGPLPGKEAPQGPGSASGAAGEARLGVARPGAAWQAGTGLAWLALLTPGSIPSRTSPARIWIAAEGHIFAHQSRKKAVTI
jgi:hypothetical protein